MWQGSELCNFQLFPSICPPYKQTAIQNELFTCYFILKCTNSLSNSSFKRTLLFWLLKHLNSDLKKNYKLKKIQSRDLLVEVTSQKFTISLNLYNYRFLFHFYSSTLDIKYNPWSNIKTRTLFTTKEELLINLKEQTIIDACHITTCWNGQVLHTKHIILTFNSLVLPTRIKAD